MEECAEMKLPSSQTQIRISPRILRRLCQQILLPRFQHPSHRIQRIVMLTPRPLQPLLLERVQEFILDVRDPHMLGFELHSHELLKAIAFAASSGMQLLPRKVVTAVHQMEELFTLAHRFHSHDHRIGMIGNQARQGLLCLALGELVAQPAFEDNASAGHGAPDSDGEVIAAIVFQLVRGGGVVDAEDDGPIGADLFVRIWVQPFAPQVDARGGFEIQQVHAGELGFAGLLAKEFDLAFGEACAPDRAPMTKDGRAHGKVTTGGSEMGQRVVLAPWRADEELRGARGDGRQDGAGEDGDDGAQFAGGARVGLVVDVVDDEQAGGVLADDGAGLVAEADEGGVFAFFLRTEAAPGFIVHGVALDFVAAGTPGDLGIGNDVGKGLAPGGVMGDEVSDLSGGIRGSRVPGLDDEIAFVRLVADAEGGEGDGEGGGLGGAAEGEDDEALLAATRFVERKDPFLQRVARQIAPEEQAIELGEALRIIGKQRLFIVVFPHTFPLHIYSINSRETWKSARVVKQPIGAERLYSSSHAPRGKERTRRWKTIGGLDKFTQIMWICFPFLKLKRYFCRFNNYASSVKIVQTR